MHTGNRLRRAKPLRAKTPQFYGETLIKLWDVHAHFHERFPPWVRNKRIDVKLPAAIGTAPDITIDIEND